MSDSGLIINKVYNKTFKYKTVVFASVSAVNTTSNQYKPKIIKYMITIYKDLYDEMVDSGVKFNEKELIILPPRKGFKREINPEFNYTNTKLRNKLAIEERNKALSFDLGYDKNATKKYAQMYEEKLKNEEKLIEDMKNGKVKL